MTMKTLTDEQRKFAEENHDLVYTFLHENRLPTVQYYDVVIFGYLRAVQEYCGNPKLQKYKFATVAWKKMLCALKDYYKHMAKDILFQEDTVHIDDMNAKHIHTPLENIAVNQDELMTQMETELILHALAKRLPSREMRIIRMKVDGAGMHDIAKAEHITFHEIKRLLAGAYDTVIQVLLG